MNYTENINQSYRLNFEPQPIGDLVTELVGSSVAGTPLKPRHYEVDIKYIHPGDIREQFGTSNICNTLGVGIREFDSRCFGYSVEVFALYNYFVYRNSRTRHLTLNVLFDQGTEKGHLVGLNSWIKINRKLLSRSYKTTRYGTATLDSARYMKYYVKGLYDERKELSNKQIAGLKLNDGGLSELIDWIKTFRRFTSRTEPDANGDFNNGLPLTAENVHKRLFIPAS